MLGYFNVNNYLLIINKQFRITDKTTGWSDVANLLLTITVLGGIPLIHLSLLLKRYCLNRGVEKKFNKDKKKKNLLEKAQDEANGEGEPKKKKDEKDKKEGNLEGKNDEMTDSDEEDYT